MDKPIITKQMLINRGACRDDVDLFEQTIGDSVIVTVKRAEKVANLFDWYGARCLLDSTALAKYQRDTAQADDEWLRVISPPWVKVTPSTGDSFSWDTDECDTVDARAEWERATEAAWTKRQQVLARAWASAFMGMHKRGVSV